MSAFKGPNIITDGLVLALDGANVRSFRGEPTTNLIPTPSINALPTTGNGWGTYNTNQYGSGNFFSIGTVSSVSSNIVTMTGNHGLRTYDVMRPQTTGGGVTANVDYFIKRISDTQFTLHEYNSSQDGSQGYTNSSTGYHKVHDSIANDTRISVNSTNFPTMWWGAPHLPNSGLVKEVITKGFTGMLGYEPTDCLRQHITRPVGADHMAYNIDASVTIGSPVVASFWARAVTQAVGKSITFYHYNYGGVAGADAFAVSCTLTEVWTRYSYTFTPTRNTLISYWFNPEGGPYSYDIASIQIEQRSSITPFVAGTRGTTAATGGGWVNLNRKNLSEVDVLVVAGGGGGGMDMGGGGGGGGVIYSPAQTITPGVPITVTVGNGGSGAPAAGTGGQPGAHQYTIPATQGGNSIFGGITAIGGGFGGSSYRGYTPGIAGGAGGSGGGASGYNDNAGTFSGGAGTAGQGNRGGNSTAAYYSGGGGGAGGAGADSPNQPNGGIGVENSILGVSYYWGGGGGGASYSLSTGGNGGNGGGGGGAVGSTTGGSGLNAGSAGGGGGPNQQANTPGGNGGANTGGGGGGGSHYNANNKGGDGGSGIVIVRYRGRQKATGGTITSVGGYTIHTFTSSGTFTPDTSANTHGELVNGPAFNSDNGGSIVFDGVNDYISITSFTGKPTTQISCEAWIKPTKSSVGTGQHRGGAVSSTNSMYLGIIDSIDGGNTFAMHWANQTSNSRLYNWNGNIPNNTWSHLVGTYDGSTARAYLNGVQIDSWSQTGTIPDATYVVGTYGGALTDGVHNFNGLIAVARIYNRGLTGAEVLQNFNAQRDRFGI